MNILMKRSNQGAFFQFIPTNSYIMTESVAQYFQSNWHIHYHSETYRYKENTTRYNTLNKLSIKPTSTVHNVEKTSHSEELQIV